MPGERGPVDSLACLGQPRTCDQVGPGEPSLCTGTAKELHESSTLTTTVEGPCDDGTALVYRRTVDHCGLRLESGVCVATCEDEIPSCNRGTVTQRCPGTPGDVGWRRAWDGITPVCTDDGIICQPALAECRVQSGDRTTLMELQQLHRLRVCLLRRVAL